MVDVSLTLRPSRLNDDPRLAGWLETVQASLSMLVNEQFEAFVKERFQEILNARVNESKK